MRMNTTLVAMTMTMLLLVLPAAASDFTLGIFGNANEDGTINMQDVTYTELIILEYRDRTELADGKHDGKINMQDVTQIELVILGKEKELTLEDDDMNVVTIAKPMERVIIITHNMYVYETLRAIGAEDMVVGATEYFVKPNTWDYSPRYFPKLVETESIGSIRSPDFEAILSLQPDVIFLDGHCPSLEDNEEFLGIPIVNMDVRLTTFEKNTRKYGYILNRREEAEEHIIWWKSWESKIDESTEGLTEDEKPLVFVTFCNKPGITSYYIVGETNMRAEVIRKAGARNLGDYVGVSGSGIMVDTEWIIAQNPPYVVLITGNRYLCYDVTDSSEAAALRDEFMSRPELANLDAIKNGNVYMISGFLSIGGASGILGAAYHAKQFHPDLFEDLDPQAVHQEYIDRFQGIDFDVKEDGIFVYPTLEES